MPHTIGIVGYGAFGQLTHALLQRFAPRAAVRVYSSRKEPDGTTFFSFEDTVASDAVILCVPIRHFEATLQRALPHMRQETVIVDVATVKVHTVGVLKKLAGERRWIATHPMFGPESYQKRGKDVQGFRIVVTDSTLEDSELAAVKDALSHLGFTVVSTTADEHDKRLAASLFLTHFIGQIVSRAGFVRSDIDTASFGHLMDAMESVRHDSELFADVYAFNPYCDDVLERFKKSEGEVRAILKKE